MKPTNKTPGTPTTPTSGKIFDVARPGRSLATPTSKPVIVGHKPQVQDPMMAHDIDDERRLLGGHNRVSVAPLDEGAETPLAAAVPESPAPSEEPVTPSMAPVEAAQEPLASTPSNESEPEPAPADAVAPQQEPTPPPEPVTPLSVPAAPAPVQPKPLADDLLDDDADTTDPALMPEAVVSHHHHGGGALKSVLVALFILLIIGAIIFDILLDAGFVVLDIPHTHFF